MATLYKLETQPTASKGKAKPRVNNSDVSSAEAIAQAIEAGNRNYDYFVKHGKLPLAK